MQEAEQQKRQEDTLEHVHHASLARPVDVVHVRERDGERDRRADQHPLLEVRYAHSDLQRHLDSAIWSAVLLCK